MNERELAFLLNLMMAILIVLLIVVLVYPVIHMRNFERMSDESWNARFDYVIDVKIKNKRFMDFVVLTLIQDVFGFKSEDTFTILDKNGRRCLMMCEPIGKTDDETFSMIVSNKALASSNFVKQVLLHQKSKGNKDSLFLIRVIAQSVAEVL